MQIKIIRGYTLTQLENEVNHFIAKIRVINIRYHFPTSPNRDNIVVIHYEDSAPSSIDVVPQEETEELEEEF